MMSKDESMIKKDRLRFTKNKQSALLAYLGIVFNVLYFISIFSSDVGDYFYTLTIGASVVYNLLFLLVAFLSSEGVKGYKMGYAVTLIIVGAMQVVRIFGIPMDARKTELLVGTEMLPAMGSGQFVWVVVCLLASAAACITAGVLGILKTSTLKKYTSQLS